MSIRLDGPKTWKSQISVIPNKVDHSLVKHLRIIKNDDSKKIRNQVIKKPWGHEFRLFINHSLEIWKLFLEKNESTSLHCHPHKDTVLILIEGSAYLETSKGKIKKLKIGDLYYLERKSLHRTYTKNSHAVLVEVESPPEKNDLIRVQDKYQRSRIGYESNQKSSNLKIRRIEIGSKKGKAIFKGGYSIYNQKIRLSNKSPLIFNNITIIDKDFDSNQILLSDIYSKCSYILVLEGDMEIKSASNIYRTQPGSLVKVSKFSRVLSHNSHFLVW
ncbi:MAG TPA: hypothetical protein PKD79_00460 [Candidatus Doudnabacteria bacterium]|nr:hypothetical protein [Candidatus Doudnabacteria bacterium]